MPLPDPADLPLWANLGLMVPAGLIVWFAGQRLTRYADAISSITGLGSAVIGILVLGGITSLPEIAVAVTAGITTAPALAVNNILGAVALQVTVIALGDAALRGAAITAQIPRASVLLQGAFCCLQLCLVVVAIAVGDHPVLGVGLWSWGLLAATLLFVWLGTRYREEAWRPGSGAQSSRSGGDDGEPRITLGRAIAGTLLAGALILAAGVVLALCGEALAQQSGLGTSFVGALVISPATSLPEISTVLAAVRLRRYGMAFSDIFGTNLFDTGLIFLIDATAPGDAVLNQVGRFSMVAATLGIALTLLYLVGLLERKDRVIGRLGLDSWSALAVYAGGAALLYALR